MLLKNKIKIGAAVGASLLTFAAIGASVGIIENQKTNTQITNNIKTSVIKNDNLNAQPKNYSNYLKDTTLTQVENLINQKINQQTATFETLSPNQAKVLQYQQELKQKSTNLAKKIMNGNVGINFLLKEIKDKYNNLLTYKQKEYINQKINQQKYVNNKISMKNRFYQYLSLYSSSNQNQSITIGQAKSIQQKTANLAYQLKVFAGLSTTAAIVSTAIAATIWAIPFWGWVEVGFATADTVVDWITVGISWAQYANVNNQSVQMGNLIYSYLDSASTAMFLRNDFFSFLWMIKPLRPALTKLAAMISTDWATNLAGSTAEPEVAAWLVPALGVISTILDIESAVLSTIALTQYV